MDALHVRVRLQIHVVTENPLEGLREFGELNLATTVNEAV